MSRNETIALIKRQLPVINDEALAAIRSIIEEVCLSEPMRQLTPQEIAEVNNSRAVFAAGRTLSLDELNTFLDEAAAARRTARIK